MAKVITAMDKDFKEMAVMLEEAMYGISRYKPGDIVVFTPTGKSGGRIKNLTPGKVYKVADIKGYEIRPGESLPIENDKQMLNHYNQRHFKHHDPTKGIFEKPFEMKGILEALTPFKELREKGTDTFTLTEDDIGHRFVRLAHMPTSVENVTLNGVGMQMDTDWSMNSDGELILVSEAFAPGDRLRVDYVYDPAKTKKLPPKRKRMEAVKAVLKNQEEQKKIDFMEELKSL